MVELLFMNVYIFEIMDYIKFIKKLMFIKMNVIVRFLDFDIDF